MRKLRRTLPIIAAMVLLLGVVSVVHAAATVSTVAITSNPGTDNNYATGDTITVALTFSEAVTVAGTPYVVLDIGEQPRHAAYSGDGSSMAAQPFSYTVLAGDKDTDGVSLQANSLTLNGGGIQTTSDSTAATLTHSAMTFANHNVDNDITLVSNIGQTGATDHITISATQSATVSFNALESDASTYTLKEIALDVQTASPTLDVTITVLGRRAQTDYVFSGSVANTGRQVFTINQAYIRHASLKSAILGGFRYEVTITGSGDGTVAIGATASSGQDTGGVARWTIADPPTNTTVPRFSLQGHEHANPFITHAEIISEPEDGMSYKAGERIEVLFVFNRFLSGTFPATADLWFGTGAAQRREASLVGQYPQHSYHHAVYAYTVQSRDADTDGILLGENPLGRNEDFALVEDPLAVGSGAHVPADLTLSATQLGAGQLVDGSQERTCVEVACIELTVEVEVNRHGDHLSGFNLLSTGLPFEYRGALSVNTFSYKGTSSSFIRVDVIEPGDAFEYCGLECVDISDPFLAVTTFPEISSVADRLGFVEVDGAVFHISEADTGFSGMAFWWTNPGFTWSDGQSVQIKLIENATASFDMASYTANEGDSFDVTVTLSDSFENTRTLPVVVTPNGEATEADYSVSPKELVFAPGETEKTFSVTLVDDTIDDDDETLTLSFDEPHIKSGGTNDTATVNITDNDDPAVNVSYGSATYTVAEGGTQTVTVTLSADPERTVTIPIVTTEQDGASSSDYSGVPANVTFSAGDTSKAFTFSATQDMYNDDGESVLLSFGTLPPAVRAGTPSEATVSITDDDDPPEVAFGESAYTVAEGGIVNVEVKLATALESAVTVPIRHTPQGTTSSGDYSGVPGTVTFNTGDTSKAFTFSATQDMYNDDGESVLLSFGTLPPAVRAGTPSEATVTITDDDDPPEVAFGESAYTVAEGGMVSVEVKLATALESAVTVPIRHTPQDGASSSDYSGVPGTVTFNTGDTSKAFMFSATQDMYNDDGESVLLSFGTLPPAVRAGTPSEATVTITDDDDPPEVAFGESAYTVAEGGMVSVEVKLATALESAVTVPIRHTPQDGASSSDYSGVPGTVTFNTGDTSKAFMFSATQDMYNDDGESVLLSFGTLPPAVRAGTPSEATVTITDDDDPPEVAFGESAYTVAEGGMVSVEVKLAAALESAVTVPIRHTPQGTTSFADYTGVPANVTFSAGDTSESFTFAATDDTVDDDGESVLLGFGPLPTDVSTGGTPTSTVRSPTTTIQR